MPPFQIRCLGWGREIAQAERQPVMHPLGCRETSAAVLKIDLKTDLGMALGTDLETELGIDLEMARGSRQRRG